MTTNSDLLSSIEDSASRLQVMLADDKTAEIVEDVFSRLLPDNEITRCATTLTKIVAAANDLHEIKARANNLKKSEIVSEIPQIQRDLWKSFSSNKIPSDWLRAYQKVDEWLKDKLPKPPAPKAKISAEMEVKITTAMKCLKVSREDAIEFIKENGV